MVKAILWDMDGVVADTGEAHFRAWQAFFREVGGSITREAFDETFGMANPAILRKWLGNEVSDEMIHECGLHKEELYRGLVGDHVQLLPGVREWLAWGRERGYRQAVASSGEMANIVAIVSAFDLGNSFDALVSGAFLPKSKPDPTVFLQAAAAVGAAPENALVIEDGIVGVEAARCAGMSCIAITTTHSAEKLADADLVINSLQELDKSTFERLLGQH